MSLQNRLLHHRKGIEGELHRLLDIFEDEYKTYPFGLDTTEKLRTFLFGGKMIRGSIICLVFQMISGKEEVPQSVYTVAAAEEIFASALLIHDDVMDRDKVRRGRPSLFAEYAEHAVDLGISDSDHYGYSQAIMVGDICFFWVQKILSDLTVSAEIRIKLQSILATESIRTGFGQMLDVNAAMLKTELTQSDIESIALNKTARYTFVLPFLLGATLAHAEAETLTQLEQLGNAMGTLFQIKDDELGLFGTEAETGKPEGNDVKEGKQTLFYFFAKQLLKDTQLTTFNTLYSTDVTSQQLTVIRDLVKVSRADDQVQNILNVYAKKSHELISQLPINDSDKADFRDFVEFNLQRKR